MLAILSTPVLAAALSILSCPEPEADALFQKAFAAHQRQELDAAAKGYDECLAVAPKCPACLYQAGWVSFSKNALPAARQRWSAVLAALPGDPEVKKALETLAAREAARERPLTVPVGTTGTGAGPVSMRLVAKFQSQVAATGNAADHYEPHINSPKSARFTEDGKRVYVNSLEGGETVVFDPAKLERVGLISHTFSAADAPLFRGETTVFGYPYMKQNPAGGPNVMMGKPVESEISHQGKFLWVPYYRRSFDHGAASPSAVAIIDVTTNRILRVMPTGPIPKYVAASPDQKWLAVTHWGDNTLGIIDVSSGDPDKFRYVPERLVVERAMDMANLTGVDRDKECGKCLRGTVFTPDSQILLVARMGDGGIAAFEAGTWRYLGSITGEPNSPRHLVITKDGEWLYLSANRSGSVARIKLAEAVAALRGANGRKIVISGWQTLQVGPGARTIELSPDERFLYVACNGIAELVTVRVDRPKMEVIHRIRTDSYTVGLAVSPDGRQIWTTSQGHDDATGGRSVCVFDVQVAPEGAANVAPPAATPAAASKPAAPATATPASAAPATEPKRAPAPAP